MSDVCTLAYRVNDRDRDALEITTQLVCEGVVDEWVGIGFTSDGLMQNSKAVLGIPGHDRPLFCKSADDVVQMPD
eukprot:scaffold3278_cov115-Skeletonema_dohrnii-CCMP3373.AAC.9